MDKLKLYAKLFGGVFSQYLDTPGFNEEYLQEIINTSTYYNTAIEKIDKILQNNMNDVRDINNTLLLWINSPVLDALYNSKLNGIDALCSNGFLSFIKYLNTHVKPQSYISGCREAVINGKYNVVKFLIKKHEPLLQHTSSIYLKLACRQGYFRIVKLLCDTYHEFWYNNFHLYDVYEAFFEACKNGNLRIAKWLRQEYKNTNVTIISRELVLVTCVNNRLNVVKWLYKNDRTFFDEEMIRKTFHAGAKDVAIWLYKTIGANVLPYRDNLLPILCRNGHTELVKWYISIHHTIDKLTESRSIREVVHEDNGNLELLKYLYDKFEGRHNRDALFYAIKYGHLDIAKWLYEEKNVYISKEQMGNCFTYTCKRGHLDMAKWVVQVADINVYANNFYAYNGPKDVKDWLDETYNFSHHINASKPSDFKMVINLG